ncbi:MAG: apolipoprotein N-acyltransferase [Bdellovibrionales bacterium]|nr:apolipoprotein N-acyltransferase [Bdellovibrionales bacterium]
MLTLIGFNWVSYTVHEFGHMPWAVSILLLLAFAGICTLSIPLAGVVWWLFDRQFRLQGHARIFALVCFMCIGERTFPMLFDWHFGYTWLWAGFPAFQWADAIGFIGLSNIGLLFNGLLLIALLQYRDHKRWWPWVATPLIAFIILNVTGHNHGQNLAAPDNKRSFLIAQANIGNEEKIVAEKGAAGFRDVVIDRFLALTEEGVVASGGKVDFAVWPETAFPDFIREPTMSSGYSFKLRQRLTGLNTKLITGGYAIQKETGKFTNSFFILSAQGQWLAEPYHKTVLLAFGEYFPFANWFPRLRKWFPEVADFGRGPGPTVLQAGDTRIGAQICYEGLFDWFSRDLALKGAQVIVNLTNDSWYGTWMQPYQHSYMTYARAIEVRRPLVRSTNTGISAVALASGEILEQSPMNQAWQHLYEVPFVSEPQPTVFMTWGFWLIPALIALTLLLLPILAFRRKQL